VTSTRRTLGAVSVALLAVATRAEAASTATVTGYGYFWPGQQASPSIQQVEFSVSGNAAGTSGSGPVACGFFLNEAPSSLAAGTSTIGEVSCTGAVTASSTACTSHRNGMHLTVVCPTATGSVSGSFFFTPRTVNPTTDYDVAGQVTIA
jgi:hypothetical protein